MFLESRLPILYTILLVYQIILVNCDGSKNTHVPNDREIRAHSFRNSEIMTARGFGKREFKQLHEFKVFK